MAQFEVDPDSLSAAGRVAERQAGHLAATRHYVADVCGRTGAFSGVLSIFAGSYREALDNALTGLEDSTAVAGRVRSAFDGCAADYVASDRSVYERFGRVFGDEVALPPYQPPGSGSAFPGGPVGEPDAPAGEEDGKPFGLARLPDLVDKPLGRAVPGPDGRLPAGLDPRSAASRQVLRYLRTRGEYDRYRELRAQGLSPAQAFDATRPSVDSLADTRVHDLMEQHRQQAYDDAYAHALGDGHDPDSARRIAGDAAADAHHQDAVDHGRRRDVLDAAGTYHEAYHQAADVVSNATKLAEDVQQLEETGRDLDDYAAFEDAADDDSAQTWAGR